MPILNTYHSFISRIESENRDRIYNSIVYPGGRAPRGPCYSIESWVLSILEGYNQLFQSAIINDFVGIIVSLNLIALDIKFAIYVFNKGLALNLNSLLTAIKSLLCK